MCNHRWEVLIKEKMWCEEIWSFDLILEEEIMALWSGKLLYWWTGFEVKFVN